MTIHHATIKRAAKLGIEVTETPEGYVTGRLDKGGRTFSHSNVQVVINALRLASRFAIEYPNLHVGGKNPESTTLIVFHRPEGENKPTPLFDFDGKEMSDKELDDIFATALDSATDNDLDTGETDELPNTGTVVAEKYREMYRERGNENHCGDWLALYLDGKFDVEVDGKIVFDVDAFTEFLASNDVDMTGKWAGLVHSNNRGWQGRYRMNGRQKLEMVVAIRGSVIDGGETVAVPTQDLEMLRDKHSIAIAKHEKRMKKLEGVEADATR